MASDDELIQRWLRRDDYNEAPVIPEGEMAVEQGMGWNVSAWYSGTAAGALSYAAIYNPYADKELDFFYGVTSSMDCTAYLHEGPTLSSSGTVSTPRNLNRTVGDGWSQVLVFIGPTPSSFGTLLQQELVPQRGIGMNYGRGHTAPGFKWVLKPKTWYLVAIRNEGSSPAILSGMAEWWERSDYYSERSEPF
jgi:hypothetical protein